LTQKQTWEVYFMPERFEAGQLALIRHEVNSFRHRSKLF